MSCTTQQSSAVSSWTTPEEEGHAEERVATPTILISHSIASYSTNTISMNEPSLSSRRGIHKTIHLPPPSREHEVPPALSTAALMKRAHESDEVNTPITPVEKLIPSNLSAPPPAPVHKKIRVRHTAKPVGCNIKHCALFPTNSGDHSPRLPLAPHLMNRGPLASPVHLVDPSSDVEFLSSPVSEKNGGTLEATPVSAIAAD